MSKRYIVLPTPTTGEPYILSENDFVRDEKRNIDNNKTVQKVVYGYWIHIPYLIRINPKYTDCLQWKQVDNFLDYWRPSSDVRKTRIYCNERGQSESAVNRAIGFFSEKQRFIDEERAFGNICIEITDADFRKYDFSSLETRRFFPGE